MMATQTELIAGFLPGISDEEPGDVGDAHEFQCGVGHEQDTGLPCPLEGETLGGFMSRHEHWLGECEARFGEFLHGHPAPFTAREATMLEEHRLARERARREAAAWRAAYEESSDA